MYSRHFPSCFGAKTNFLVCFLWSSFQTVLARILVQGVSHYTVAVGNWSYDYGHVLSCN